MYQIRPVEEADTIRETASVLEDVLKVVCGDVKKYSYSNFQAWQKKKVVRTEITAETKEQIEAMKKNKQDGIDKQKEQEEKVELARKIQRIKHSLGLKEKLVKKQADEMMANDATRDLLTEELKEFALHGLQVLKVDPDDYKSLLKKQIELGELERFMKIKA